MGSTEMLRYLLNTLRADPNVVDSFGGTPLLDAVNKGHAQAAMLLRSFGAELLLQNAGCLLCSTVMG